MQSFREHRSQDRVRMANGMDSLHSLMDSYLAEHMAACHSTAGNNHMEQNLVGTVAVVEAVAAAADVAIQYLNLPQH